MANSISSPMSNSLRIATFNIGLDEAREKGQLAQLLLNGDHAQARKSAQIIQTVRPDILLINEIDGNDKEHALRLYQSQYLGVATGKYKAIEYPYHYMPDCNTGVDSGVHFTQSSDNHEKPTDKYGFGYYDGQYCMAILSMYPIDVQGIHTYQRLLWKDFPDARLPLKPIIAEAEAGESEEPQSWYSEQGLAHFRLSSKTHADVPIKIKDTSVHILISHPTPPVFDGAEDRNGRRNFDEILFWRHYINGNTHWLKDDEGKSVNGLSESQRFVIMGDLNASVVEGDATEFATSAEMNKQRAIDILLNDKRVAQGFSENHNSGNIPSSLGAKENDAGNPWSAYHTAAWKMRADYVLPSAFGFELTGSGVFWPKSTSKNAALVNDTDGAKSSSDHRLVWLDLTISKD